ncbi:hypothetical protein [Neobacillus sp. FSL H8-0543]|uniref:hypothetical protein n=1 Tax=Neobacillus sp. FSL H8-0543 TaxID=2954672 RepID=UPI0031597DB5
MEIIFPILKVFVRRFQIKCFQGNTNGMGTLMGGFGDIDSQEEFTIIWKNTAKSRKDLGILQLVNQILRRFYGYGVFYEV